MSITRRRPNRIVLGLVLAGLVVIAGTLGRAAPPAAHGGGLDRYGCHNNRKAGNYHCHRGGCAGKAFASQSAMLGDACAKAR